MISTNTDHRNVRGQFGVDLLKIFLLSSSDLGVFVVESVHKISTDYEKCRLRTEVVQNINTLTTKLNLCVPLGIRIADSLLSICSEAVHQTKLGICCLDKVKVGFPLAFSVYGKLGLGKQYSF